MLLDSSELTLDLVHILELLDKESNQSKILSICNGLKGRLERLGEAIKLMPSLDRPYDAQAAKLAVESLQSRITTRQKFIQHYREQLNRLVQPPSLPLQQ